MKVRSFVALLLLLSGALQAQVIPQNAVTISTYGYSVMTKNNNKTIGLLYEGKGDLYFLKGSIKDISK